MDKYGYNRASNEVEWIGILNRELGKMRDVLNLATGVAFRVAESREEEIRLKAVKIPTKCSSKAVH